jgi:FKBP-type peptidyl-prolyl cis-trans isomerase FkpA
MHYRLKYILALSIIMFTACDGNKKQGKPINIQSTEFKEKLMDANKIYMKQEDDEINQYVAHQAMSQQKAKVNYKISLLDGTICYSSDTTGAKEFTIEQDDVDSGLHEGIQYMHVGDKATLILPSHLAHGLVGDQSRIPPRASVMYELELLSLR